MYSRSEGHVKELHDFKYKGKTLLLALISESCIYRNVENDAMIYHYSIIMVIDINTEFFSLQSPLFILSLLPCVA